ncbi:MAG TPA: hypothetical protein PLU47_11105, partial [Azonexus sp.]|nr:hypothetical protein [Azonexus sp.]
SSEPENLKIFKYYRAESIRPEPLLFLATCGRSFISEQRTRCQTVQERDCSQHDQADGDDRMRDEYKPMPGGRVRPFGLAFHQDTVFIFFADYFGHKV